jgi:hypothetical protein
MLAADSIDLLNAEQAFKAFLEQQTEELQPAPAPDGCEKCRKLKSCADTGYLCTGFVERSRKRTRRGHHK